MPRVPPEGKRFKKGKSGNPKGSSAKAKVLRQTVKLTAEQLHDVASVILHGNHADLAEIVTSPKSTILQMWTASLVEKSIEKGDPQTFRVLMERLLGRPKESITLDSDPNRPVVLRYQTEEEKLARINELRKLREDDADD